MKKVIFKMATATGQCLGRVGAISEWQIQMRLIISPFKNPLFHTFKPILSFLSLQFLQLGILFVTVHAYLPDLRATDPCVDTCWKLTKYTFKWKITLMSWTNPGSSCFIVAWKVGGKKGHELLKKLALLFVEEWDYLTNFLLQECC